jgi:endonuclease/exonuclease/phosphatase family metal-dependent hydrolase
MKARTRIAAFPYFLAVAIHCQCIAPAAPLAPEKAAHATSESTNLGPAFVLSNFPLRHASIGTVYSGCVRGYAKASGSGEIPTFAKASGPAWLAIAADGALTGTPSPGDAGPNTFGITATDSAGRTASAAFAIDVAAPGAGCRKNLKVLSYNLFHGWGKFNNGIRKGLDSVILSGADVICMAETTDNASGSNQFQAEHVANELGWYSARIPGAGDVGVASRYPIVETYPRATAIGARIRISESPLQEIVVYSAHFDYRHYGPYEAAREGSTNASTLAEELASQRDEQAAALVRELHSQLADADRTPLLVCGDFNSPSHQDWTAAAAARHHGKAIAWPATLALAQAGMVDTFRFIHPDPVAAPGDTWSPIYNGSEPLDRIDFIFA